MACFRLVLSTSVALLAISGLAIGQQEANYNNNNNKQQASMLSRIPGGQTSAAILASSADGMSRYFAPDGPIQPGITAIMGLPMRGGELLNQGITRLSSGLNNGAQSLSQSAGQNGNIQMPGMEALESSMPTSFASLGESMHNMIRSKNNFIRGQAEAGIQAGNRLSNMMRQGLQGMTQGMSVRSSGHGGGGAMEMMSSAQDFMVKSGSTLKEQAKEHLKGTMSRLGSMQGMGEGMRNQAEGLARTMSSGMQGAMSQLHETGEKVMSQLQGNHHKNMAGMSGILGSFQDSMGSMGGHMQKNMEGLMRHAQSTHEQLTSSLQGAIQAPMKVLSSLTDGLGSMMMKGGAGSHMSSSSSSGGGRY